MEALEDVRGVLKVFRDGSIFRLDVSHLFIQANEQTEQGGVATKDVILNQNLGLWVRIYLPSVAPDVRLPVMLYFHGGGFCLASPGTTDFHNFSAKLAATAGVMIVSVNYRLAPEHRLPAAYEDCFSALQWLNSGSESETWVRSYADPEKVYLLGDSAGGNIVHQVILRCGKKAKEWIKGAILLQPFFGGEERKRSEVDCVAEAFLSVQLSDAYWRLSLPSDCHADRDHPYCNPLGPRSPDLREVEFPPLLVALGGKDVLRDRGLEYCEELKKMGKEVDVVLFEEEEHAFYALKLHSDSAQQLTQHISRFLHS
ncbi:probable carboxylesterase 15 [Cryptomeria japonica]|uniref:probable carboxylesterase 15 n=1 Tax=Cryptomeria japonica TaxID=3369 RepID=UPI0027DA3CF4|nr:probable carboxylesterase 15 [Cryptomeria japonica]